MRSPYATRRDHRVAGSHGDRRRPHRPRGRADLPLRQARRRRARRRPHRRPGEPEQDARQGVRRPHPDEPLGRHRRRPLVRRGRLPDPGPDHRQRLRPALQGRLDPPGHRHLGALPGLRRLHRAVHHARHPRPDGRPAAQPARPGRPQVPVRRLGRLAGVLRRVRDPRHRPGDPDPARAGRRDPRRRPLPGRLLGVLPAGRRVPRAEHRHPAEPDLPGRHDQARRHHGLGDHRRPQHEHGRRLAPLPGVPQHLVQARAVRRGRRSARCSR